MKSRTFSLPYRILCGFLSVLLIVSGSLASMGASGCSSSTPQTVSILITAVGVTGESLATARGDVVGATAIHVATIAAAKGAADWKSGQSTQENAIQLFGILQKLLLAEVNAIDPGSNLALYATIISAGIDGVIAALPQEVTTAPSFKANISPLSHARAPLASQKDYKAAWNGALATNPVPGLKKLK